MNILLTRLLPLQPPSGIIPRETALAALRTAAAYPLCLLAAPAGSGKTTLLAAWAAQEAQVAWVSLEAEENDPARFWCYFLAAFQRLFPGLSMTVPVSSLEFGAALLNNGLDEIINQLAQISGPIYLVLDDYQHIQTPEIHRGIRYWIEHQPAQAHLLIATRVDPPRQLASLRVKNMVGEVQPAQLHFSAGEIQRFFAQCESREFSAAEASQALAATGGWAAGIRMLALKLRGQEDLSAALAAEQKGIVEYLTDEVINQIPQEWRFFLTDVSVLETLQPDLCTALTGNPASASILEQIYQANLFTNKVREAAGTEIYQLHPFFREALQARLAPEERKSYHQKAAAWLAQSGQAENALRQALAGEGWDLAVRLVIALAETKLQEGEIHTLHAWLEAIPEWVRQRHPGLQALYGWVSYLTGKVPEALHLEQQMLVQAAAGEFGFPPQVQGWWSGLRCQLALVQEQNARAVDLAKTALEEIHQDSHFFRGMLLNSLANAQQAVGDSGGAIQSLHLAVTTNQKSGNLFGTIFAQASLGLELNTQGKRNRAEAFCREALEAYTEEPGETPPLAGVLYLLLAQLLLDANQLEEAAKTFQSGIDLVERLRIPGFQQSAMLVQAAILEAQGNTAEMLRVLNRANRMSRSAEFTGFRRLFAMMRAENLLKTGQLAGVENWLEEADLPQQVEEDPAREAEYLLRARFWIETGQLDLAQAALARLEAFARQTRHHRLLVQILLAQAVADWKQGLTAALKPKLEDVLSLAVPEQYLRILWQDGAPVLGLLAQLPGAPGEIQALFRAQAKSPLPQLGETLTAREIDVLRMLAKNLTNLEIAQRLVLSSETIKVHLKHIFQKLDVTDRRQAVQRARGLGVIE